MKNLKIGKRMLITFLVIAMIASVSGLVSVVTIRYIDDNYDDALTNYGFAQGDIGKAMIMLTDSRRCVRDIISYTDQKYIDAAKEKLEANTEEYNTYYSAVEKTLTTEVGQQMMAEVDADIEKYRAKRDEVIALGDTTDEERSRQARIMAVEELDPLYEKVYNDWAALMDRKVSLGNDLRDSLSHTGSLLSIVSLLIVLASLVISGVLGVVISRGISRPITEVVKAAKRIADGNLDISLKVNSRDEIGMLANAFQEMSQHLGSIIRDTDYLLSEMAKGNFDVHTMAETEYVGDYQAILKSIRNINYSLSDTLSQINEASDQVSSGSDQVSSGAQALSQGATEQASSIEELAATITEITRQVEDNAESAKQADQMAAQTGEKVMQSNEHMQEMIQAMGEISNSSNEISKIIKTIEDIAFQTNILALNAAVEAARAGAAGKGFAVVADEVRSLASKSAQASSNTASLIENSIQAVDNGTRIADETAQALTAVVEGTKVVTTTIEKITNASNEQAASLAQVTQGIDQISSVVQTNSATAEESAAASEELSGQAQMLKDLVGQFKLKKNENAKTRSSASRPAETKRVNNIPAVQAEPAPAADRLNFDGGKY